MTSPGQELKKAREARGLSLKAVSDATRITLRYLEAVESDRLAVLPGGFFVKAILRNYARAVGLDEEDVVQGFRRAGLLPPEEPEGPRKGLASAGPGRRTRPLAGAAVALIVLLSFGAYWLLRSGKAPARPAGPGPSPAGRALVQTPAPAAPETAPVIHEEKGLKLALSFREDTWLQVYADGRLAVDGIRMAGDSAEVRAETEILIHIGNAGGLTYAINGRPGRPFGRSGAVVKNIRITPENAPSFLADEGTGVR